MCFRPQSDKLQEQQDLIAELQGLLANPDVRGLGLNLYSRPHTAPIGSMQQSQNGASQVTNHGTDFSAVHQKNELLKNTLLKFLGFVLQMSICTWLKIHVST